MSTSVQPPVQRGFTAVELLVVITLVVLLAIIATPVLRNNRMDEPEVQAERKVQDAVRRYIFDTKTYPTFRPIAGSGGSEPWEPGSPLGAKSLYAGLNLDAAAIKLSTGQTVHLFPDYLAERPKYDTELAAEGLPRWRIDAKANIRVQMDGRSY